MTRTAHSETGTLDKVYLRPVHLAFQNQAMIDRQYQNLNFTGRPDLELAIKEWEYFEHILSENGVDVRYFDQGGELTIDSMYCRDASIVTDHGVIICSMGKNGRIPEPPVHKAQYLKDGLDILGQISLPGTVEGGDVAWIDQQTLAVGHGYRTNIEGIHQLKQLLHKIDVDIIVVDLPHYQGPNDVFHLMSIYSPISDDLAVVYSPLMPVRFRSFLLERGVNLIEVPDDEFQTMGCNVLAIAPKKCLITAGNPITSSLMRNAGCEVVEYSGDEISHKGGGGPTCLTRPVTRIL